jgi:ATP/maltotriose-dependent transcriptional regulator MalT
MTTPLALPFVGRHDELDRVQRAFDRCRSAGATLVAVEAPAGHGKSAFLRRVGETLGEVATVIRVAPTELEQVVPYGLLQHLQAALSLRTPWIPVGDDFSAHDPWDAGSQLLELANEHIGEPVVLLIDDVHWADDDSLTALVFAFRRLGSAPLLAVVAFRSEPGSTDMVRRLSIDESELLRLDAFTTDEVVELANQLDRDLGRTAADRLTTHTGGSPLHVRALFDELSAAELNAEELPAPRGFTALVWAQLARCSRPGRDLLAAAALLDTSCRVSDAIAVSGVDEPERALDEAVATGLVVCRRSVAGLELVFGHPLERAAVIEKISPARTIELHRRAAEQLEGVAALEHAVAAAVGPDDDLARRLAEVARADLRRGAANVAATRFRQAAAIAPPAQRAGYLLDAVDQLLQSGDLVPVPSLLADVPVELGGIRRRVAAGVFAYLSGESDEAAALLEAVWSEANDAGDADYAAVAAELMGQVALVRGQPADAVTWAGRAATAFSRAHLPWTSADAIFALGSALLGRQADAEAHASSWEILPGDESFRATTWRMARGVVRLTGDRAEVARLDFESVAGSTSRTRLRQRLLALVHLSTADFRLGRWDDAVRHADLALSLAVDSGHDALVPMARATLAGILAVRGDVETAAAHLDQISDGAVSATDFTRVHAYASALLGTALGEWADVVEACRAVERAPWPALHRGLPMHPWPALLGDALVELRRLDEAEVVARRFHDQLVDAGRPVMLAEAELVLGNLAAARNDLDGARAAYRAAGDRLDSSMSPFVSGRLAEARGRLAGRQGDGATAAAELDRAAVIYRSLGAVPFEHRVVSLSPATDPASDTARMGRDADRSGPGAQLSPRELAVVSLVAIGWTNRQVAAELYVSVKTVEYHLGNVYAKVGVPTRTALAAWWLGRPSRPAHAPVPAVELEADT